MSERPTTNVRYLRGQSLDQEQTLFANYYKDLIENFGIESTYFRHDTKFPNSLDMITIKPSQWWARPGSNR